MGPVLRPLLLAVAVTMHATDAAAEGGRALDLAKPTALLGAKPEGAMDCAILPSKIVHVASPIPGVLAEVLVRPGQHVEAGQTIARVDVEVAAAELAMAELRASAQGPLQVAKARFEAARAQYQSARRAAAGNVISQIDYEKAKGDFSLAERDLEREREQQQIAAAEAARMALLVSKGEVKAPVAGVIGEELLAAGEAVAEQPLAQIVVVEPMRVEVFVPLDRLPQLRSGAPHLLLAGSTTPVIEQPELDYISPLADQSSRTIRAYYHLSSERVAPGFRCFLLSADRAGELTSR